MNPYESPTTRSDVRHTMRSLWRRELMCPQCGQRSSSVGRACLLHPQFFIRCENCGVPSRLRFARWDWLKMQAAWIFAVGIAVGLLALLLVTDPFQPLDVALQRFFPAIVRRMQQRGWDHLRLAAIGLFLLIVFVVPILLSSLFALRVNLRMIAFRGTLEQVKRKNGTANT